MLRVTVHLVPFGDESRATKIAEMVIANTGTGDGSYEGMTAPDDWSGEDVTYGKLVHYDRSQSVWELVRQMLGACRLGNAEPNTKLATLLRQKLWK